MDGFSDLILIIVLPVVLTLGIGGSPRGAGGGGWWGPWVLYTCGGACGGRWGELVG